MKRQTLRTYSIFVILMIALSTTACNGLLPQNAAKPSVALSVTQANGDGLTVGESVTVQIAAVADGGISRVELLVDGQLYATLPVTPAASPYLVSQSWTPEMVGSHIIQAIAYNADNQASDPGQVIVSVAEAVVEGGSEPVQVDVEEAAFNDTLPQPTATQSAPATNQWPTVTALVDLNVRTGPGLDYQSVGVMPAGQSAQITGQSVDGNWWEIVYPVNSNGRGWVSASSQYGASQNTIGVPVAAAPTATPTTPPTPTATVPAPTATPETPVVVTVEVPVAEAQKPTIYQFTADRYTITAGESVTLSWDLANAQAAYLRHFDIMEGVVAPGSKVVSPAVTTVYTLIATNDAGSTTVQLTITVIPAADDGSDGSGGSWFLPDPGIIITPIAPMPINPDLIVPINPTPTTEFIIGEILPLATLQLVPVGP